MAGPVDGILLTVIGRQSTHLTSIVSAVSSPQRPDKEASVHLADCWQTPEHVARAGSVCPPLPAPSVRQIDRLAN